jgi:anti-anti-sigma factor
LTAAGEAWTHVPDRPSGAPRLGGVLHATGGAVSEDVLSALRGPLSAETRAAAEARHQLEVHVDRVDGILIITPIGEIDIVTGGLFLEALIAAISTGESRLIVDLGRVPFMDSTGLAIFLSAHRALRSIDGQLRLVATAAVAEVFELAWMDKFFPVHADVADAVANVNEVGNRRDRDGDVEPAVHSRAVRSR